MQENEPIGVVAVQRTQGAVLGFKLIYRRGSFMQMENFDTAEAGFRRARHLILQVEPGCRDFAIRAEDGSVVMRDGQIRDECEKKG
jgi:hypothetical protein